MPKGITKHAVIAGVMLIILILVNVFAFNLGDIVDNIINDYRIDDIDINISLNNDGSALIHEVHSVNFKNRDNPWWNYFKRIGFDKVPGAMLYYDSIEMKVDGVSLTRADREIDFDDIDNANGKYMYENQFYTYTDSSFTEIGVVMPDFDNGIRKIEFSYIIGNILMEYSDVGCFYYKLISDDNAPPIDNLNATITFPQNSDESLRYWLHLDKAKGYINAKDNNTINVTATDIPPKTYVEVDLTLDKGNFMSYGVTKSGSLSSIIDREQREFNEYKRQLGLRQLLVIIDSIIAGVFAFIALFIALQDFLRNRRAHIKNVPIYIHEPPKDYTVEEAMPVFHYYDLDDDWWSDVLTASILNLIKKNYLAVVPGEKRKSANITIVNVDWSDLTDYERIVMGLLSDAGADVSLSMKDFEKWCKAHYLEVDSVLDAYKRKVCDRAHDDRLYSYREKKPSKRGMIMSIIGICMSILMAISINPFFVLNIVIGVVGSIVYVLDHIRSKPLKKAGERKYLELKAFQKFMLDFSNFDKKTLPELVIWEDYMVWATGMGIADEVAKQLAIVYPDFKKIYDLDDEFIGDTFLYMYLYTPRYRVGFFDVRDTFHDSLNAITNIKAAAVIGDVASSVGSGIGGGGGFSGGGGGFGGGGMGAR